MPTRLTIKELSASSRYSVVHLRRLVKAERIPYFQPTGTRGRLLFPLDAIERITPAAGVDAGKSDAARPLSGPRPKWRRQAVLGVSLDGGHQTADEPPT